MSLTDLEFALWAKRLNLPRQTMALIKQIRSSPPSRRGEGWGQSMTGFYPSRKMGVTITFDSHTVEYPGFLQTLEYDPEVLEYFNQPLPIKLSYAKADTNKRVVFQHTPDVFVIRTQTAGWEEWKQEKHLAAFSHKDPARFLFNESGEWHCPPGESYANALGLYYRLRSSAELSPNLHRNLIFLDDYRTAQHPLTVGEAEQDEILRQVQNTPGIILADLLHALRVATADHIYILIAQYKLYVDLVAAPLAEPDRVHLFRDYETATIYTHVPPEGFSRKSLVDHSFVLAPGTHLRWDNQPWVIINVGETEVYLKGEADRVITLSPALIEQLAKQGKLLGLPSPNKSPQSQAAEELLMRASTAAMAKALHRYSIIEHLLSNTALPLPSDSTPKRTKRNWIRQYRLGVTRYGIGLLGLLDRLALSGNRTPRMSSLILTLQDKVIEHRYKRPKRPTVKHSHNLLRRLCRFLGLDAPSYETFCRAIRLKPKAVSTKVRQGSREAYKTQAPLILTLEWNTPRHGDRPFEIGHIDHTELPIELVDSLTGMSLGRPWATFLSDAFSRCLLAVHLTFAPPSYRSCMMVLRICRMRHARWPQILVVDRGAEFQSTSFDFALAADNVTKKLRPPSAPRFGSTCERLFNTVQTDFIYNLAGNTQATRTPRTSTSEVDPKGLACWTLNHFFARLEEWAYTIYEQTEHGGIFETPQSAFLRGMSTSGARKHRLVPYDQTFYILTMPVEHRRKAKIIPGRGLQHQNTFYWNAMFLEPTVEGTYVEFRPNPDDLGVVYVFIKGLWIPAVSDHRALLSGRSYQELRIATEQYRRRCQTSRQRARVTPAHILTWYDNIEKEEEELIAIRRELESKNLLQTIYARSAGVSPVTKVPLPSKPIPDQRASSSVEPTQDQRRYAPQILEVR